MIHIPKLIIDLALILVAAGIVTLIFKKLKQPLVLGYIIAGLLVGPNFPLFPTISDIETIKIWAEIGVIFLLFTLGLEFSFKKLAKVGGAASITAIVEVLAMIGIGFVTGTALGWSTMDSIFLGCILSMSSTTIIIRAFDELGIKGQKFARLVFGTLIVEDLVAILLLVLLSTLAISQQFAGGEMLVSVLKLAFFLTLWFLAGIFILPSFLKATRKLMSEETLLIVSLGLCLAMVVLATAAGFSPALGAFIMGSILAETVYAEKIEHLVKSIKDLFGAIFFVSVGMLIEPALLLEYIVPVLIITGITIAGKSFSTLTGALVAGQPLRQSVQAGMSMAQIGEFSFIIATLGLTLNVTSEFLYPIAVAVSAITTFTTPYLIHVSEKAYLGLARILPSSWLNFIERYSSGAQTISHNSEWRNFLRSYMFTVTANSVLIIGIILLCSELLWNSIQSRMSDQTVASIVSAVAAFLLMAPFLWALMAKRINERSYNILWLDRKSHGPLVMLEIFRVLLALALIIFLLKRFFPWGTTITVTLAILAVLFAVFPKLLRAFYSRIESRFLSNLNEREDEGEGLRNLLPWDARVVYFTVSSASPLIGNTLEQLSLRERFGISIVLIIRGNRTIYVPGRNELIFPTDRIAVVGTDEQLEDLRQLAEPPQKELGAEPEAKEVSLHHVVLSGRHPIAGKTIRDSRIREETNGLVVGIERNGQRLLNPDSTTVFQDGDIVWIVGNKERIDMLAAGT